MTVDSSANTQQMQMQMQQMDGSGAGKGGMKDIMQSMSQEDRTAMKDKMSSLSMEDRSSAISQMKQVDQSSMNEQDYVQSLFDILDQEDQSNTTSSSNTLFSTYA